MTLHPSVLLLAALALAGGSPARAGSAAGPADRLAQSLRDDPQSREDAGRRLEAFLLEPDASGKSFVDASANQAALGAVAHEWARQADAVRLAGLVAVAVPKTPSEARLRLMLSRWSGEGRIGKSAESSSAAAFFTDAADKAAQLLADPRTRDAVDAAIQANDDAAPPVPGARESIERARSLRERRPIDPNVFGAPRAAQALGAGAAPADAGGAAPGAGAGAAGGRKTPEEMSAVIAELNEAHRTGKDRQGPSVGGKAPPPVEFQALGSVEVAKAPGILDRAASLKTSDAPTIAADLKQIRETLKDAELPSGTPVGDGEMIQGGNGSSIRGFFEWLRSAKESDMPSIDYTILPKGEIGSYALSSLGKGDIKVNHFIRSEPDRARATVVVHELFHYWDKKVAKNYYANVSYGKIADGTKHIHEYDAYLATSLYWQMVKQEGDASPLARVLDRIPTDPQQVREMVNGAAGVSR